MTVRILQQRLLVQARWVPLQVVGRFAATDIQYTASDAVLLYKNDKIKPKYFRLISIVSGVQLIFWCYLSYFALTELSDDTKPSASKVKTNTHSQAKPSASKVKTSTHSQVVPSSSVDQSDSGLQTRNSSSLSEKNVEKNINSDSSSEKTDPSSQLGAMFTSLKWRVALSLLSLTAGVFFAVTACMYPLRVVSKLRYIQRGSSPLISITTFTPLGSLRAIEVPLQSVLCTGDRVSSSQLALKVKGHSLHFLLDRKGQYIAPKMFDTLIGSRKRVM